MTVKPEPIILSQNGGGGRARDEREDLIGLSVPDLERVLLDLGEKPFRGRQVAEWIYGRGARDFATMTNLPQALRAKLDESYRIGSLRETARRETPDRKTRKFALALPDGGIVESVYMSTPKRVTFCLSSQHGCGFACRFCATGRMGRGRNLTAGEILEQALRLRRDLPPGVSDAARSKLMPINRTFPLAPLMKAVSHHVEVTGRRVTFEYILIEEINDSIGDAAKLVRLVGQIPCKINLIPYNPIGPGKFKRPSVDRIQRFVDYLGPRVAAVTVRYSQGVDIGAACGQLAGMAEETPR